jgi:hypothetical protein
MICGKRLNDSICSPRGNICAYKASLIPPLFIEVSVPIQDSERSCDHVYVLEVSILTFSMIFGWIFELFRV